jgi:hypothetical protein
MICNNTSAVEKKIRLLVTLKSKFLSVFQFSLMQKLCIAEEYGNTGCGVFQAWEYKIQKIFT